MPTPARISSLCWRSICSGNRTAVHARAGREMRVLTPRHPEPAVASNPWIMRLIGLAGTANLELVSRKRRTFLRGNGAGRLRKASGSGIPVPVGDACRFEHDYERMRTSNHALVRVLALEIPTRRTHACNRDHSRDRTISVAPGGTGDRERVPPGQWTSTAVGWPSRPRTMTGESTERWPAPPWISRAGPRRSP